MIRILYRGLLFLGVFATLPIGRTAQSASPQLDFQVHSVSVQGKPGFRLTPPLKHHFNVQAPLKAQDLKSKKQARVQSKREHEVVFTLDSGSSKDAEYELTAYLCDDANTYCLKVKKNASYNAAQSQAWTASARAKQAVPTKENMKEKPESSKDEHGFYDNRPQEAIREAKVSGKLLLIDFYGIWCPPCNLYIETVFPKQAFQKEAQKFVLLKMDADDDRSWSLKSQFKVGGYPTILFASVDSKGKLQEVDRAIGFFPLEVFVKKMNQADQKKAMTLDTRLAQIKKTDIPEIERLIEIQWEKKDYASVKKLTQKAKSLVPEHLLFPLMELVVAPQLDSSLKPEEWFKLPKHQEMLKELHERFRALSSFGLFHVVDVFRAVEKSKWVEEVLTELEVRINPKTLMVTGTQVSIADVAYWGVELAQKQDHPKALAAAWKETIEAYRKMIRHYGAKDSRGLNLELAYCLYQSGKKNEAKAIYARMIKQYPKEFTFYYAAARMYLDIKELKTAREMAEKAFQYSYGDNRLRSAERLVQVMKAQGENENAVKIGQQVLSDFRDPKGYEVRTDRYIQALKVALQ